MIWLIGKDGMLGLELARMLDNSGLHWIGTGHEVDITDVNQLYTFMSNQGDDTEKIQWIVNCAAYTAVNEAEDDRDRCRAINVTGSENIARCAQKSEARLIHISTDYVFNGKNAHPYNEEELAEPVNVYGRTKRDGEKLVLAAHNKTYIVRTSWLYGQYGNNFVYKMLRLMNEKNELSVINDQRGSPTWTRDIADIILSFIHNALVETPAPYGMYHYANTGETTWYDFALEIQKTGTELSLLRKPCVVTPCASSNFPEKVRRPPYSVLDTSKIQGALHVRIPEWKESLGKFLSEIQPVDMRTFANILVTGGSGFIGSNFIHMLLQKTPGFFGRVINIDSLTYAGNESNLSDIEAQYGGTRYFFEHSDITDRARLEEIFKKYNIDTVIHFAAESHVDRSIQSPETFIITNILGTFRLLEAARQAWTLYDAEMNPRIRQNVLFHHVSTDEVYGSLGETGNFTEKTPYDPHSPYSASKASSDHLVLSYFHTYGLPITLSNCSNNYGPYQFPEKFIPCMIHNILEKKQLPIYGTGTNIRDWLFVEDHTAAIWTIINKGKKGEKYNIGGENEWENLALLHKLIAIVAEKKGLDVPTVQASITLIKDRPGHDLRYALDCSKIKNELGWKKRVTFEDGLRRTVDWYLK